MKPSFDPNCQLLAASYLRKQCKQLLGQWDGIRNRSDIEYVHRARVASRRLRAALETFGDCFPNAGVARWQKQVRKITKGLGTARDLDVQREYLAGVLAHLQEPAHFPGIARLLVRTELERDKLQPKVRKAVDRLERNGAVADMLAVAKAVLKDLGDDDEVSVRNASVLETASKHITGRLAELVGYQASLDDPDDLRQHHAMRIATKKLRYTMEAYKPAYEGLLNESLGAVKQLQTLLGDLHDCDVWIDRLPAMLEKERLRIVGRYGHSDPLERLEPGVAHLLEQRRQQRQELFRQLQQFWCEQSRVGTWEKLDGIARGAAEPALEKSPATVPIDSPAATDTRDASARPNANACSHSQQAGPIASASGSPRADAALQWKLDDELDA